MERVALHPAARLKELEQRARRRFGQNFLVSPEMVDRIARAAGVGPDDRVLEIGPGLGILTERLRSSGAEVRCIEIDRDLAAALRQIWPDLELHEGDAMKSDFAAICPGSGWKVVANLPYNVATPLLLRLTGHPEIFSTMVLMFQREVGDRIAAEAGHPARGSLSVQIQARARARQVLQLPPGAFHPAPKVHSVVLAFDMYAEPDFGGVDPKSFDRVVRLGFQHRRKTLLNSLGSGLDRGLVAAACATAGIDSGRRAETLDLAEWRRLARAIKAPAAPTAADEAADEEADAVE